MISLIPRLSAYRPDMYGLSKSCSTMIVGIHLLPDWSLARRYFSCVVKDQKARRCRLLDKEWDSFVANASYPSIFQTSLWGEVVRSIGQQPYRVEIRDSNGRLIAGALLIRRRTTSLLSMLSLNRGLVSWGPVASDEEGLKAVLRLIIEESLLHGISEVLITNDAFDPSAFATSGFENVNAELDHEIVIDLQRPLEDLWKGLDKDCRSAVRKAERDGVEVSEGSSREFYELYLATRERLRVIATPRSFFEKIESVLGSDLCTFLLAKLRGQVIGGILMLRYGGIGWYYEGASDADFWIHRGNNLLQWKAIELGKSRGLRTYNLTQAPSPSDKRNRHYGLYLFKSQFGGALRPLRTFRYARRRYTSAGRFIYSLAGRS